MQNSWACNRVWKRKPESAAQWAGSPLWSTGATYVFYPMSMGKLTGTLGNAKHLASSPDLPATKLHGSCSHLPFASLQFFFHSGPDSHSKWREAPSHCLATWRIHRETRAGHRTGPASHVYLLVKDLASGPVHLRTSTNVCVQLCANCVFQTCLSDWAFLTTVVD